MAWVYDATTRQTDVGIARVWRGWLRVSYPAIVPRSDSAAPKALAEPAEADATSPDLSRVLATPLLDLLDLPPRISSFAYAEGLETIGDLARIPPSTLLAGRNLGRTSVGITRRLLEERMGVAWEDVACPERNRVPSTPPEDADPDGWDAVRKRLGERHRRIPLGALDLSPGLRARLGALGIVTLGDLAAWSRAKLLDVPGIGGGTLKKLPLRATVRLDALASEYAEADRPLLGEILRAIDDLEAKRRLVIRTRMGLEGPPLTIREIAVKLRLSRERVRQLEVRSAAVLRERAWAKHAEARIELALSDGPVPFAFLSGDPWWATACEHPSLVAFVVERVLDELARVIEFDGAHWLSRQSQEDLEAAWSALLRGADQLVVPASEDDVDALLALAVERLGPCRHVMDRFRDNVLGARSP